MVAALETNSTNSSVVGRTEPRIWTRPLRELTPETSYGFDVIDFARDILGITLDPWQEWLVIHAGELLEDGTPRFRTVLALVARQNGKTTVLLVLTLYWMFWEEMEGVLWTSINLGMVKRWWRKAVQIAQTTPELAKHIEVVRHAVGDESLETEFGGELRISAANRGGGRSMTVDRLVIDELREHHDWEAHSALMPTMQARPRAQAWMITNAGDDRSIVLNDLREQAIKESDPRLGIFEWSAPDGSEPDDLDALAAANPSLGSRVVLDAILGEAKRAKEAGGEQFTKFLTEVQCRRVAILDPAIDPDKWAGCLDVGTLDDARSRVALCVDVSLDGLHATLCAAAQLPDGRVRVEPVKAWAGTDCVQSLRRDLPGLVERVGPKVFGWFPNGPSAALAADMSERRGWPPRGVKLEAIRGDATAACMGFREQVASLQIAHSDDPLLNAHVAASERKPQGDGWRFTRRGVGHVDAVYAAAGATHLARTLPPPRPKPRVLVGRA